jgi:SPP1 gp7 family putative phage head morphogenesis protein
MRSLSGAGCYLDVGAAADAVAGLVDALAHLAASGALAGWLGMVAVEVVEGHVLGLRALVREIQAGREEGRVLLSGLRLGQVLDAGGRWVSAEVEKVVFAHLHKDDMVERPAEEPDQPVARTDAPPKNTKGGAPASKGAIVAAAGAVSPKLLGGIANHMKRGGGVAFDRLATAIHKKTGEVVPSLIPITPKTAGIEDFVEASRNAALDYLEAAGRTYASQVRSILEDEENFELPIPQLKRLIEERAEVSSSKAMLLSVDQTMKLNSGVMRLRHEAAGIRSYTWSTSLDERVRPMHADLEGQVFSYDDPPETNEDGDTNNPGSDYRCRCVAIPVLEDEDEEPQPGEEPEEDEPEGDEGEAAE